MLLLLVGCRIPPADPLPGETDFIVNEVFFEGEPTLDPKPLRGKLALRPKSLITAPMPYNAYREAEDRRRIVAFWQTFGFFDVQVTDVRLDFDEAEKLVDVTWVVDEGIPYTISEIEVVGAPAEHLSELREAIPFDTGAPIDMETYRKSRFALSDVLRRAGYGHAETYTRAFVSREDKSVAWYYYVDPGPLTRIRTVTVEGSVAIPTELVLERAGLEPGAPYSLDHKDKAELDLLDTGAFAVVHIETTADNEFIVGALPPDTGGKIPPERIAADGSLIPRELDPELDLNIVVVEAPSEQGRVGFGAAVDPTRLDGYTRGTALFRNLFGPQHHLILEGLVGYGWRFRSTTEEPLGFYGQARVGYHRPGGLHRLLDWRIEARFDEQLYPGYHLRSFSAGLGFRISPARGLFLDVDTLFRYELTDSVGTLDEAERVAASLPADNTRLLGELAASVIYDQRDDPVETLDGYMLALRSRYAPGSVLGNHAYVGLEAEARYFIPLATALSLGFRARAGWVFDTSGEGVPLGARLFGGGSFDMRGFTERSLSPYATRCQDDDPDACDSIPVGGLSTVGGTVELRWLPNLKQYGVSVFTDIGSTSNTANPFAEGVSVAVGAGLDIRLWYVPFNLDFSYRVTDDPRFSLLDHFFVFLRVGEAF